MPDDWPRAGPQGFHQKPRRGPGGASLNREVGRAARESVSETEALGPSGRGSNQWREETCVEKAPQASQGASSQ